MKEAYYFPHDANARTDAKILELRAELGWEGYGLWWALVEQLREATDYRLSNERVGGLAMGLGIPKKQLESLLSLCFDVGLLALEDGHFFAPALRRRMEPWDAKRTALAEAGKRGAARRWAGDKPPTGQDEAPPPEPQSPGYSHPNSHPIATPLAGPIAIKGKEKKEEESKLPLPSVEDAASAAAPAPVEEEGYSSQTKSTTADSESPTPGLRTPGGAADVGTRKRTAFVPPSFEEILAYMTTQRPYTLPADVERVATKCFGHYSGNGWKVGKNPMKDWKGGCQTFLADLPKLAAPPAKLPPPPPYSGGFRQQPVSQVDHRQTVIEQARAMLHNQPTG